MFTRRDDDGGPDQHPERWDRAATIGWLLGADVRVPGVDPRFRLATQRVERDEGGGPGGDLSWVLAAAMLIVLALVFAELGGTYPVAGGSGRFPYYSHGAFSGFVAAWASWLQAVAVAPIEILGAITYVNSVAWVNRHFDMLNSDTGLLNAKGLVVATILMIAFTAMNLAGAKFMSESNGLVVIWKTVVPLLAIIVIMWLSFHPGNFTAGGGFMPFGVHGIFAALPLGVVFALQGFEQAVQLAGEAKNPQKDMSRAIITAMIIGALLYIALQAAFIFAVKPSDVKDGWAQPLGTGGENSSYGAWYTLALAVGAGWLAVILIIDAVISPSGSGIVYIGTTARLSYALGELPELPTRLASTDRRGVPVWSIIVSAVVGWLCSGPSQAGASWSRWPPALPPSCTRSPQSRWPRCAPATGTGRAAIACRCPTCCCRWHSYRRT